jgi:hypothetical protein
MILKPQTFTQITFIRLAIFFSIVNSLLIPMYLNHYPIMFSDTGAYIEAFRGIGSFLHPPADRPVFYSIFIYLTSLGRRILYLAPVVQALFESEILYSIISKYDLDLTKILATVFSLAISFLSVMTSCIEPDVWFIIAFSAIVACGIKPKRWIYTSFIIYITTLFAPANGVIIAAASGFLIGIFILAGRSRKSRLMTPFVVALIAGSAGYLSLSIENYIAFGIPSPIAGSSMFLFARFNASKIGKSVLSATCIKPNYTPLPPCKAMSQYTGIGFNRFLWSNEGFYVWSLKNISFFNSIDKKIEQKDPIKIITMDLHNAIKLSLRLPANMGEMYGQQTLPAIKAVKEFHLGYSAALNARQHKSFISFSYIKTLPLIEALFLLYAVIVYLFSERDRTNDYFVTVYTSFTLATFILNSMIDGLSETAFRFNAKGISVFLVLGIVFLAFSTRPRVKKRSDM